MQPHGDFLNISLIDIDILPVSCSLCRVYFLFELFLRHIRHFIDWRFGWFSFILIFIAVAYRNVDQILKFQEMSSVSWEFYFPMSHLFCHFFVSMLTFFFFLLHEYSVIWVLSKFFLVKLKFFSLTFKTKSYQNWRVSHNLF